MVNVEPAMRWTSSSGAPTVAVACSLLAQIAWVLLGGLIGINGLASSDCYDGSPCAASPYGVAFVVVPTVIASLPRVGKFGLRGVVGLVVGGGLLLLILPSLANRLELTEQTLLWVGIAIPVLIGPWLGWLVSRLEVLLRLICALLVAGLTGLVYAMGWRAVASVGVLVYPFLALEAGSIYASARGRRSGNRE